MLMGKGDASMKIGTVLTLVYKQPGNEVEEYHCKVIERNKHYLIIDYPIHKRTKKTSLLPMGAILSANYIGDDHAVYQFLTKMVAKVKMNVPAIAIAIPKKEDIKRIQRREFVRVHTTIDTAIHSLKRTFEPFTTVTTDISGGGMSVIMPKNLELEIGEIFETWLALEFKSGTFHYVYTKAQVVFTNNRNNLNAISVKFLDLKQKDQQMIIRYTFEKQREARKKELT